MTYYIERPKTTEKIVALVRTEIGSKEMHKNLGPNSNVNEVGRRRDNNEKSRNWKMDGGDRRGEREK